MTYFADFLLVISALAACVYCIVLSKKLNNFKDTKDGVGGAVAALNTQVHGLQEAMQSAQSLGQASQSSLVDLTQRAEQVAQRLELLVAAMHDLPDSTAQETRVPESVVEPVFSHSKLEAKR